MMRHRYVIKGSEVVEVPIDVLREQDEERERAEKLPTPLLPGDLDKAWKAPRLNEEPIPTGVYL